MTDGSSEFEVLVREFLEAHPTLRHEWKTQHSWLFGPTREVTILPSSPEVPEVWASESGAQIAVGVGDEHTDFEDFGRGLTDAQVAQEALNHFAELLHEHGYLDA